MTEPLLTSQPEPEHIASASIALARILAGDVDLDTRLALGAALAVLGDVHPPYPAHPEGLEPLPLADGLAETAQALTEASRTASTEEALRIAETLRELNGLSEPRP